MNPDDVLDSLSKMGHKKIEWIYSRMPILQELEKEFSISKPFNSKTIGICLHIEPKTAGLIKVLTAGGAKIVITGSPGTTQEDVAAALRENGNIVYGSRSDTTIQHIENIQNVVNHKPDLFLDNGADLYKANLEQEMTISIIGGTEETTSGANKLRSGDFSEIEYPIIVINDSPLKRIVENEHGVGQTIVEGFMSTTNLIVPGKRFVVLGYGFCGRGVARYLKKFGAIVTVVDTDPIKSLEAAMDGFTISNLKNILDWGDVFITVTGFPNIIREEHFISMKDNVILANAGHFSNEIQISALRELAIESDSLDSNIEKFTLENGKNIILLAKGEMLNLASGRGNPAETMDLGLALQAYSLERVAKNPISLESGPQPVPDDINKKVAEKMLIAFGYTF